MLLSKFKCIVIKIGSSILTDEDGALRTQWLQTFCEDVAHLRAKHTNVIIVTSGAVALGRGVFGKAGALKLEEKQAAAACGQIRLVQAWRESLLTHNIETAQLLLTIDDSENRRRYLNARSTLQTLLSHDVIPIINENDTVATAELRFGDNDRLAARVAQMASADGLILLSDIDGFYTANPHTDSSAVFIKQVNEITPDIEAMAGVATSNIGTGGMVTKLQAARIALGAGCHMAIAPGKPDHPLKLLETGDVGTWFMASSTPVTAREHWIGGSIAPKGTFTVDEGAVTALYAGKSLLPAGVAKVEGVFERGDAVIVKDSKGNSLGKGLSAYSNQDALKIMGQKSENIEKILGFKGRSALIHRDDLVLNVNTKT